MATDSMGAVLNIPEEAFPDLKRIMELDEAIFTSLLTAIGETAPALTYIRFRKTFSEKVKLPNKDIQCVLGTAFALFKLKEKTGRTPQETVEEIINSDVIAKSSEFQETQKDKLRNRLLKLLAFDTPLGVSSKALDVMTEHERIFCGARILSDIRSVFAGAPESADAAVIIHNLQIAFHQAGQHQEFYFALDTNDLKELKAVIARAEKKTIALEQILKKSQVPYLEV